MPVSMYSTIQDKKAKDEEQQLRFDHSKHEQNASAHAAHQRMVQAIEDRHRSAQQRYQKMCAKKEARIAKSR